MTPAAPAAGPHIGLIASPCAWRGEREQLRRLAVALVGDGAMTTLVEPQPERDPEVVVPDVQRSERRFELPRRTTWEPRVPFWRRGARIDRMLAAFERSMPDLLWTVGVDAWTFGTDLAEACDRPVALEFRCRGDLRFASKAVRSERVVALVAPCEALARAARAIVGDALVRTVPLGVRVVDSFDPPNALSGGAPRVVAILGEGRDERAFAAALQAARTALEVVPDLYFLVEFPTGTSSSLWRFARTLGILDRTTAIDATAVGGRLAMTAVHACDLVLSTEAHEGPRPEVLAALGRGVPVIAVADPMADALVDGETAIVLGAGEARAAVWTDALLASLQHPEHALRIAAQGRRLVLARHRSSSAALACLATATDLVRGGPMAFAAATQPSKS